MLNCMLSTLHSNMALRLHFRITFYTIKQLYKILGIE